MKAFPSTACQTTPAPQSECRLCLRVMTDPRVMDCLHVFCLECIVGCRVIAGNYECRVCKAWTCVRNDDPKNLPVDLGLANFMERNESLAHCVWCAADRSKLKIYCFVCQGFLCGACETGHHDIEYFSKCRGHLFPIGVHSGKELWTFEQSICSTHGSFTEYFCRSCYISKCTNCITDVCKPAGHRYDKLENHTHSVREAIGAAVNSPQRTIRPPTGACGGDDIFTNMGMFVSETNPSTSRDLLKSASVKRQTMFCVAKLGTHFAEFKEPSGVAVNKEGDIFVADANSHIIQVFDKDGVYRRQIVEIGKNGGQMKFPNQVAICPKSGHIVITERSPNNQVQVFTQDGRFVRKFGKGTIQNPRGVTVDNRGRIIVMESKAQRVRMFKNSKHLKFPNGVAVNDREEIFISDNLSHCIQLFNYSGSYLGSIGGESITKFPIGVCMSSSGDLWVADNHINFNVTVFNQKGDMVAAYEYRKNHEKCLDAALSKDGSIVVASQDRCVYIYHVGNGCKGGSMGNGASGSWAGNESNAPRINEPRVQQDLLGTRIWQKNSPQ